MPYPSEHAARIHPPANYQSFARKNIAPGIDAIFGIRGGRSEIQAYRFDAKKFSASQAKAWLSKHQVKVLMFEPASEEVNKDIREKAKK